MGGRADEQGRRHRRRKIELVFEEETNPKDTIERFRRLILQEKVEAVHGLISTGVSLGVAAGWRRKSRRFW